MSKKKNRKQMAAALAQEIEEWEEYLLKDLRERIEKNGGEELSERQLKKTINDATYERMVRVVGRGDPERLRQRMREMVQDIQEVQKGDKHFEGAGSFEPEKHFEPEKDFETEEHFEVEECFEPKKYFEESSRFETEISREVSQSTGRRKKWDKASLLAFLREKCHELGRVPTSKEVATWSKAKLCPSYPTCMKLLGAESKAEWEVILLGEGKA